MKIVHSPSEMTKLVLAEKAKGRTVGLVPTMGNLHDGHVSLVEKARADNDVVVVSIFVNPTQFGPNEDFNSYPRTLDADIAKIEKYCDVIFAPSVKDMYGDNVGSTLFVTETGKSRNLCGKFRPGHFDGVLTVVKKLFSICVPDTAYFGLKDYQQFILIKDMATKLNLDVKVVGCSLIREKDGLAMSSRNSYMDRSQRERALALSKSLSLVKGLFDSGERNVGVLKTKALEVLLPNVSVQYFELVKPNDLEAIKDAEKGCVVAVAAFCDNVRLIDNIIL